tara:strand:- start:109 stop:1884 length:1776 start_codon:yes stop_codon:yes gene_type:complete
VDSAQSLDESASEWLSLFENLIIKSEYSKLKNIFYSDAHWRDILAFTWHIKTFSGIQNLAKAFELYSPLISPSRFKIDKKRTSPRLVMRAGRTCIEVIFSFEMTAGKGSGVLRLCDDENGAIKAWTISTELHSLTGFEEHLDGTRPKGFNYSKGFDGPNWLDDRKTTAAFLSKDPTVLIVGAGQAGLSIAARLGQLSIDTLIVDQEDRIGNNWRNRYHRLSLHNQTHVNHLPYMKFPPNWPAYIPKDKLAGWFEAYVESMELNVWTNTQFTGANYNDEKQYWDVTLRKNNEIKRTLRPRHIIMATGVSGIPHIPNIPSLHKFDGSTVHSSEYKSGEDWKGKRALVIGSGNSGHDIAQDLYANGVKVLLAQRGPTTIVNIEPSAQLPYRLYEEGLSLEDCDLLTVATPLELLKKTHQLITEETKNLDKDLLSGLSKAGFKTDFGNDNTGWQFKYLDRGGGYYFNVGCSDLIVGGKIKVIQFTEIDFFTKEGLTTRNGSALPLDLIVLATGFKGQQELVQKFFGAEVAKCVGPIWGFDPIEQELRNMWTRTPHPGLWFIAGSFAQCRIYSKYLGLQIKACEEGMIPLTRVNPK